MLCSLASTRHAASPRRSEQAIEFQPSGWRPPCGEGEQAGGGLAESKTHDSRRLAATPRSLVRQGWQAFCGQAVTEGREPSQEQGPDLVRLRLFLSYG